ncbi:NAD(P)-dependent oxidoreductase [Dactylosporangium sp. NPDC051485]|uniref:NAD-dependent epimerase/dehydratase family protein n=1 Tax=Dactylosporangium sp. NPDC051485 TaxID=3154846 RepID=UPI00341B32D3
MRIFVAGASGVLGRAFLPLAITAGHEVIGMTRSGQGTQTVEALGATPVLADALDRDQVAQAVAKARPDAIVDLLTDLSTGNSASNALLRTEGTRNLVDAARMAAVDRFVAESISWIHAPGTAPADEDEPLDLDAAEPRRTTILGVQALENAAHERSQGIVLRFGQLYGNGTWYARNGRFADAVRAGGLPATETVTSFVHVDDAARATLLALGWPAGTWNIVDDEPAPGTDWVPVFARAMDGPDPLVTRSGDAGRPVANGRARAQGLVLQYPSWRDGFLTS